MKTLNYLHIPKTGGKSFKNLISILEKNNLSSFHSEIKNFMGYEKYSYVHTIYGTHAMESHAELDTACIFRDPLDRLLSQFAWAQMENYYGQNFDEYKLGKTKDLLRYFLFEDEKMTNNQNLQTKFICNSLDIGIFYSRHGGVPLAQLSDYANFDTTKDPLTTWYMKDNNISLEYAKDQIDKMHIIDTIENHDRFISKVCGWFLENYDIDIEQEFRDSLINENPTFNYSIFTDAEGKTWTTADLKALLTPDEVAKVYENNSLDLEIYNYVKSKLV